MIWAVNAKTIVDDCKRKQFGIKANRKSRYNRLRSTIEKRNDLPYCDPDAVADNAFMHSLFENPRNGIPLRGV